MDDRNNTIVRASPLMRGLIAERFTEVYVMGSDPPFLRFRY